MMQQLGHGLSYFSYAFRVLFRVFDNNAMLLFILTTVQFSKTLTSNCFCASLGILLTTKRGKLCSQQQIVR